MSEPTSESPGSDSSAEDTGGAASDDDRLIPDDKLPDDLNPDKNPLAADPDDEEAGLSPNGPDAAAGAPGG